MTQDKEHSGFLLFIRGAVSASVKARKLEMRARCVARGPSNPHTERAMRAHNKRAAMRGVPHEDNIVRGKSRRCNLFDEDAVVKRIRDDGTPA